MLASARATDLQACQLPQADTPLGYFLRRPVQSAAHRFLATRFGDGVPPFPGRPEHGRKLARLTHRWAYQLTSEKEETMGLFSKLRKGSATPDPALPVEIVIAHGKIHGLTKPKKRGFIQDSLSGQSIFFNSDGCSDFDALEIGQDVDYTQETDPGDPLRVHAVDVHRP
jgi:hypothetical protein